MVLRTAWLGEWVKRMQVGLQVGSLLVLGCFQTACGASVAPDSMMARHVCARAFEQRESSTSVSTDAEIDIPDVQTKNVILLTIDGVRWQEVFGGTDPVLAESNTDKRISIQSPEELLPNLYGRVLANGVAIGAPCHGAPMMVKNQARVSLPGYLEILGGAPDSNCLNNNCQVSRKQSLFDDIRRLDPLGSMALVSSWDSFSRIPFEHDHRFLVSAGRRPSSSLLGENDPVLTRIITAAEHSPSEPGHGGYRPDRYTAPIALRYIQENHPRFVQIALGDPDEYAHSYNYAGYLDSLRFADSVVGQLLDLLQNSGLWGKETTLLITTDHGRAHNFHAHGVRYPESARVWLFATGGSVVPQGFLSPERTTYLADIAPTIRGLLGVAEAEKREALFELLTPRRVQLAKGPSQNKRGEIENGSNTIKDSP